MKIINELTEQQDILMGTLAAEYEAIVLSGDDSYDPKIIQEGIDFIYEISDISPPGIVICSSPMDMALQAGLGKGEIFDGIGCGYDVGWTAFYDFMQRIGVEFDKNWRWDVWKRFVRESGVFAAVLRENIAFVCVRPCAVHRRQDGNLHNDKGRAIEWADGYGEYFLNGVAVDEALVMTTAEKLDAGLILKEKNAEVRREIVRKIGIERVVVKLGTKSLDKEGDMYELLDLDLGDGRRRPYLKMRNPSIGTWHLEGVPPDIQTVREALAWRNQTTTPPETLT